MNILGTMIINTLNANLLTFVLGKIYGRNVTGNFFQAYKWDSMAFSTVGGMLDQVAQPVMVSARDDNDPQREVRIFRKLTRFAAFLAFPAMFGLALVAHEFIIIALTDKWVDSIIPLQLLCLSGAFMPLYSLYKNLIISQRRSDVNLWLNIGQVVLQLLVIVAFYRAGFIAMVAAYSAFNILWLIVWHYYAKRLIGVRFRDTLRDILPFMLAALVVMALTWFCTLPIKNIFVLLPVRIALASILYFGIMKAAHAVILEECLAFVSSKFKKQK
jgi:O-antigen/teichoic acid export membrane protein